MKLIDTVDAVGHVLCHDLTRIVPGESKGPAFRKGHVVKEEDIPVLLSMGKAHLYVWENDERMYHEDQAAQILFEMCNGKGTYGSDPKEGKIEVFAETDGLLEIDSARLMKLNSQGEMMIATRQNLVPVRKGDKLAGTRVIPLVIEKKKMNIAKKIVGEEPLMSVLPFEHKKVAMIITGSEVAEGRIDDAFGPVLEKKLGDYDTEIIGKTIIGDDPKGITTAINDYLKKDADMILCTGGMSVDPDDTTPSAIKWTGAEIITYGAPVLPGAMFLLAYTKKGVPIMGLPGCVMYSRRTIFDIVLPMALAGKRITSEYLSQLGMGGLCLDCETCIFPDCGFGR